MQTPASVGDAPMTAQQKPDTPPVEGLGLETTEWERRIQLNNGNLAVRDRGEEATCPCEKCRAYRDINRLLARANSLAAEVERLRAALKRQRDNIEHWLATGEAAGPDESKSIYEQICAALSPAPTPAGETGS